MRCKRQSIAMEPLMVSHAGPTRPGTWRIAPGIFLPGQPISHDVPCRQLAFFQGDADPKKPGKYLCKLNQHVLQIPISVSGPNCALDPSVAISSLRTTRTGRGHFSPKACPQNTAVHMHSLSCMGCFSFRRKQHRAQGASLPVSCRPQATAAGR
jgi:hypothetical protein